MIDKKFIVINVCCNCKKTFDINIWEENNSCKLGKNCISHGLCNDCAKSELKELDRLDKLGLLNKQVGGEKNEISL